MSWWFLEVIRPQCAFSRGRGELEGQHTPARVPSVVSLAPSHRLVPSVPLLSLWLPHGSCTQPRINPPMCPVPGRQIQCMYFPSIQVLMDVSEIVFYFLSTEDKKADCLQPCLQHRRSAKTSSALRRIHPHCLQLCWELERRWVNSILSTMFIQRALSRVR